MTVRMKLRLEADLEKGDQCPANVAAADALSELAAKIRNDPSFSPHGVVDVPRGRAAYLVENT